MNTIRVVVEYVLFGEGRVDYAGGRFCYHSDALIDIEIPDGATPVQALIYDLHDPDEIIRITFMQSRHRRRMSDDQPGRGALAGTTEFDVVTELDEPDQLVTFGDNLESGRVVSYRDNPEP